MGMDLITFDKDGNMAVKITDTPQWAPIAGIDPSKGNSGSIPVTINKVNAMNALSKFSSQQPGRDAAYAQPSNDAYQYRIDVSMDGKTYIIALDQTKNIISRNTIFEEIPPVKCRFVRLTLTNWPRITPLGILEFTVFGKPAESLPAAVPIPVAH